MRNIARLSDNDRRELFRNTADKMGLNDAIVEKDFWVCFTLDFLFHRSPWKESITFKGGTSLSKAFHLISRFSEDIDLILDWRVLGYGKRSAIGSTSGKVRRLDFVLARSASTRIFLPSMRVLVTMWRMVSVLASKSMASHRSPITSARRKP